MMIMLKKQNKQKKNWPIIKIITEKQKENKRKTF